VPVCVLIVAASFVFALLVFEVVELAEQPGISGFASQTEAGGVRASATALNKAKSHTKTADLNIWTRK
jgi:hypothetical protein